MPEAATLRSKEAWPLSGATSSESSRSRAAPIAARQVRKLTQKRALLAAGLATVVVPSSEFHPQSDTLWTGKGLSGVVAYKNSEVESKLRELGNGCMARAEEKDHTEGSHATDDHQERLATKAAMMDLKSTIDIVEKELKSLISGNKEHAFETLNGQQGAHDTLDDDDAETGRGALLRRLQIYRYKRRVSPPTLPLVPLSALDDYEAPEVAARPNDKIERNLRRSRLGFLRTRHSRVKLFNQRTSSRSQLALQHRAKASQSLQEKALQRISDYEAKFRPAPVQETARCITYKAQSATQPVINLESSSRSLGIASA